MKIFLWILVIWVIISLIQGTIKEGSGWLAPFVAEYKYQFKERPLVVIVVTIVVVLLLIKLLF